MNILETIAGWFHRSYGNRVIIIKGIIWYIIFGLFYALFMTDTVRVRQEGIQGVSLNGTVALPGEPLEPLVQCSPNLWLRTHLEIN